MSMIATLAAHHHKKEILVFRDTFTDVDQTPLENHTPDYAVSPADSMWTVNNITYTGYTGRAIIVNNKLFNAQTAYGANSEVSINTRLPKHHLKTEVIFTEGFGVVTLVLGVDAIQVVFLGASSTAYLRKTVNISTTPVYTTLATYSLSVTHGEWIGVDAYRDGTAVQCKITKIATGASETLSVNDPTLRLGGNVGATLDNWEGNYAVLENFEVWRY